MRSKLTIVAVLAITAIAVFGFLAQQKLGSISNENKQMADKISAIAEQSGKATPKQLQQQIDAGGFQGIFLDDVANSVYFGKLSETNANYLSLTDVYYVTDSPNPGSKVIGNVDGMSLVKLGSEMHGPKDYMYIPQNKVQFIENLKDNSKIVKAIQVYESKL